MTIIHEAIPKFVVWIGRDYLLVNAWSAGNVLASGEDGLAYEADGVVHVNPARILMEPREVASRLAVLRASWSTSEIVDAIEDAQSKLRAPFCVTEAKDGVHVELHDRRLLIGASTWQDRAVKIARTQAMDIEVVRRSILDHAFANLATAIAILDW